MAGKERSFKKTFSGFPYLPSKGSRVNLLGLSEFADPVVQNEPWLIENETSFTWAIDLYDAALGEGIEVSAADAERCIVNGWKIED